MAALDLVNRWPVQMAAAGWLDRDSGRAERTGPTAAPFRLASVTKVVVATAILVAVEEGTLSFDQPLGPTGSTLRHVLAHASGLPPEAGEPPTTPESRRIYSNAGFELLGSTLADAAGMPIATYINLAVAEPLGLRATTIGDNPAHGGTSTVDDLLVLVAEWLQPTLVHHSTLSQATTPQFPQLAGVLPGFGRMVPNPWGLGFELRGEKSPHWTSPANSPGTFGHFGRAGTFVWVDPVAGRAAVALTDRDFGPWATTAWPNLSTAILAE